MLPTHLQRKDTVIISMEKLQKLFEWRDNNRELIQDFTPVLEDVVIQIGLIAIHVEPSDHASYSYKYSLYEDGVHQLEQYWNRKTFVGVTTYNMLPPQVRSVSKETLNDYIHSVVSIYPTLMAYMERHRETVERKERTRQQVKTKQKKKGKPQKKITYIRNVTYTMPKDIKTEVEPAEKRAYTSPVEPFKVRGHWRTYKSGKQVWIPAYTKVEQKDKQPDPKTYKL